MDSGDTGADQTGSLKIEYQSDAVAFGIYQGTSMKSEALPAADQPSRNVRPDSKEVSKHMKKQKIFSRSKDLAKVENFQVTVKIHKARRLSGSDVKPLVQVKCGNLHPQTTRRKSGSEVSWNETLVFTLEDSMNNVKDYLTEITVLDSRKLRSDSIIGSFKFDLGNVYDQEGHAYTRKWLLLTDPNDFDNRPQGYLKFTISLLGSGDPNPFEDGEGESSDDEDDVHSNLLMPVGANLRTVLFVLRVYRAEDLPQMDWSLTKKAKNLVDPYVTFSFCGVSKRTSTISENDSPVWNERLVVPVKIPSFCETLKLDLTDYDFPDKDDPIGSVSIPLSSICLPGYANNESGFLPTFGPCFINVYNSSNQGAEEDQYRGRVLVELTTLTEEFDYSALDSHKKISEQVKAQCENYMMKKSRSEYCLVVMFQEASMIEKTDGGIKFQISMGNYTTSFTSDLKLFLLTADKKGPTYYYIPWGSKKPMMVLKSRWENIEFRYRTLNALLKEVTYMEKAIKLLEERHADSERDEGERDDSELAVRIIHMFDEAIKFFDEFLSLNPIGIEAANDLDAQIFQSRMKCLDQWKQTMLQARNSCSDVKEAIKLLKEFKNCLKDLSHEPQGSIPDVILRMEFSNDRVAFARIPAYDVLYSRDNKQYCGRMCGITSTVFLQYAESTDEYYKGPVVACQLQATFWLGLQTQEADYVNNFVASTQASISVYAETQWSFSTKMHVKDMVANWKPTAKGFPGNLNKIGGHDWLMESGIPQKPFVVDIQIATMSLPCIVVENNHCHKLEQKKVLGQQTTFSGVDLPCPIGWKWKGDWKFIKGLLRNRSLHLTKMQEVYEVQERPGGDWSKDSVYIDEDKNRFKTRSDIHCERNWAVKSNWQLDLREQIQDGWEYSNFTSHPIWLPRQQTQSLIRRRRWYREIKFVDLQLQVKREKKERDSENGWIKFKDGSVKRRWIRLLERDSDDVNTFTFQFDNQSDLNDSSSNGSSRIAFQPTISMDFKKCIRLQTRVYVYQARDLLPLSKQSYAKHTPFVYAFFMTQGVRTRKKDMKVVRKLNPCWDQTLLLEMEYCGDIYQLKRRPPPVLLHIYVKNDYGKYAWLGEANVETTLQVDMTARVLPVLNWCPISRGRQDGGAILAAAEIFTVVPGKVIPEEISNVPVGIAPRMVQYSLDMILLGVRDMKTNKFRKVMKPSVIVAVGDVEIRSDIIKDTKKSPNFQNRHYKDIKVSLPDEKKFWPPIVIRMKDHQFFGVRPTIGEHVIHDVSTFMKKATTDRTNGVKRLQKLLPAKQEVVITIGHDVSGGASDIASSKSPDRNIIDWWSKYHASVELVKIAAGKKSIENASQECQTYLSSGLDTLDIYRGELEEQIYDGFNDVIRSFPIYAGRQDADDEARDVIGELKGQICIYETGSDDTPTTSDLDVDSLGQIVEVKVRVYILKAYDLAPKDKTGLSDPYVLVSAGKKTAGDRRHYRANSLNPVFGQFFDLDLTLPFEKTLRIEVYDWDAISKDDKIGETKIDLENRFHSKHWAWFGLPKRYHKNGLNKWRLQLTPKALLKNRAARMKIEPPSWNGNRAVTFNRKTYALGDFEKLQESCTDVGTEQERLALYVLREYPHVNEHVETRTLYSDAIPGIPQGKLELWVDMFPKKDCSPGEPENISPRKPKTYYARVVVWNCSEVPFADVSILGERMTDIYVKGWLEGMHNKKQKTDTHYRSLDGSGMFNWRLVFPFQYIPQEQMLVVTKKEHFWNIDQTSLKCEPTLHIQVWDEDLMTPNEYLGEIAIPLNKVPASSKSASSANLKQLPALDGKSMCKTHDLFEIKVVNGWWPLYCIKNGERTESGKIELTIEVLPEEEHLERNVGKGRKEPNEYPKLLKPNRPKTSFAWFSSPFKSIRYILWRRYRLQIIIILIVTPILAFLTLLIYTAPSSINNAILHVTGRK